LYFEFVCLRKTSVAVKIQPPKLKIKEKILWGDLEIMADFTQKYEKFFIGFMLYIFIDIIE
jgi:predicted unusual protein kinase regulating ubiquinone biosynthesis (AarF/ABC1/UbiB family)